MKAFKYSLNSIWKLRKSEASQALTSYINSVKKVNDYYDLIECQERKENRLFDEFKQSRLSVFFSSVQDQYLHALREVKNNLNYLNKLLREAKQEQLNKFQLLLEAQRKEKMLENLYDKRLKEYNKDMEKRDNLILEENAYFKYINK